MRWEIIRTPAVWQYIQGGIKIGTIFYALTLPNINRFLKLFHCQNQQKICIILSLKIPPHLKCVAALPCEMSSVLKATTENKTTSVTTHFKKLTTGNNVFIVSVISKVTVISCTFYIKYSMCPPCCWTTHSSQRRHWPMARSVKRCDSLPYAVTFHKVV